MCEGGRQDSWHIVCMCDGGRQDSRHTVCMCEGGTLCACVRVAGRIPGLLAKNKYRWFFKQSVHLAHEALGLVPGLRKALNIW